MLAHLVTQNCLKLSSRATNMLWKWAGSQENKIYADFSSTRQPWLMVTISRQRTTDEERQKS